MKKNKALVSQSLYLEAFNQIYDQLSRKNPLLSRRQLFSDLIDQGILESNGLPTQLAIQEEFIKVYQEVENMSFSEFLNLYPFFNEYDACHFEYVNGYWEMDEHLYQMLQLEIQANLLSDDALYQLQVYFEDRKINGE
ncbi:hypothetical protein [Vaginisenegalia massiliensis]|uniref:hypothetical protein n=1 Tax=Vaginisenegalia massiliensis TaxID=2058294 RepID=UPI000F5413E5|nr:hypothetical protein [Vaginisenegalia massiliensis]